MNVRLLSIGLLTALAAPGYADIVYDSTRPHVAGNTIIWTMTDANLSESASYIETPGGNENEARVGAAISLAGTNRFVTSIQIPVAAIAGITTVNFELTLYTNAGGSPGTVLWSGVTTSIAFFEPGSNATFSPNVTVPGTFFYTLAYSGIPTSFSVFGARYSTIAASVGSNGQMMTQDSTTLAWSPSADTHALDSIEMQVTAIPAPGSIALPTLGLLSLVQRRRR